MRNNLATVWPIPLLLVTMSVAFLVSHTKITKDDMGSLERVYKFEHTNHLVLWVTFDDVTGEARWTTNGVDWATNK